MEKITNSSIEGLFGSCMCSTDFAYAFSMLSTRVLLGVLQFSAAIGHVETHGEILSPIVE